MKIPAGTSSMLLCVHSVLLFGWLFVAVGASGRYDPCAPVDTVLKDDGFLIGVALWPGSTADDWGDAFTGASPCNPANVSALEAAGVKVAVYNVKVDTLTVTKLGPGDEQAVAATVPAGKPRMVTMVAFRAGFRSQPRTVLSEEEATGGKGYVSSLAMVLRFDKGALRYMLWHDLGCGGCARANCINDVSCAEPVANCGCSASANSCSDRCSLALHLAFAGEDRKSQVFLSAQQLFRIGQDSISTLYSFGSAVSPLT